MALYSSFALLISFGFFVQLCFCWPPIPPPSPPSFNIDIPGHDLGGMPVILPSDNYTLCEDLCKKTVSCRAWAYGVPGCDDSRPRCWLKFFAGETVSNKCRVYNTLNTHPCQLETQWTSKVDPANTLPDYPRPQLVRGDARTWKNLNGLWQFQFGNKNDQPPFGKTLKEKILVPFPVESCLSGIGKTGMYLWYRLVFHTPFASGKTLLHFGAVDWQTTVYVNTKLAGNHTGGYDGFTLDITSFLGIDHNELLIFVYDPSDYGRQVFGKQRISAIENPGGDTYTPNSGIWQTVWVENVPETHVERIKIETSTTSITVNVTARSASASPQVKLEVKDGNNVVVSGSGNAGVPIHLVIPNPKLWSPQSPFLYNLTVTLDNGVDVVNSYFGLRTVSLGKDSKGVTRPLINGQFTFFAGWLDQSFWPDGIYTAPTDDALRFDVDQIKRFGFNFVRLHQKVNPERWYWFADKLGIIVQQDMVQHYGDPHSTPDPELYMQDLKAMIDGRYNHPCIVQWTAFNEGDMVSHFDPKAVVQWIRNYDPSRLVDTDSGGPANDLHVGDVNDVHTYPDPKDPKPSSTQYAEIGEFGGLGAFLDNHQWAQSLCGSYETFPTPDALAASYIGMAQYILQHKNDISASVYTQITDVELECDGFLNYDRTDKFSPATLAKIVQANQNMIHG